MSFSFSQPAQSKPFSFSTSTFQTQQQPSLFQTPQQQQQQQQSQQPQTNAFGQPTTGFGGSLNTGFPSSFTNPSSSSTTNTITPSFGVPNLNTATTSTANPTSTFSFSGFPSLSSSNTSAPTFSTSSTQPTFSFQAPSTTAPSVLSVPVGFPQQKLPATPETIVRSVREAWDPSSPYCQFKHYFYNLVHPSQVKKYTKGPNDDEKLWEHAVQNNPDPSCLVPALAVGFVDLKKRVQEQEKYLKNMRYRLGEISIALDLLSQRHEVDNRIRIQEVKRNHQAIAARVLSLMKKIHCLRNKGMALTLEEDRWKGKLETLIFQLKKPGQFKARLATLWREVSILGSTTVDGSTESVIAADAEQLHKVLSDQYQGISHVIEVMKQDQHDLNVMEKLLKRESDAMFDSMSST